jgi:ferritin-like metal-binding protein YciE
MPEQGLKELYIDELKDLYNAENQLVKALPKMAKAASSDKLRQGFEEHFEPRACSTDSPINCPGQDPIQLCA